MKRIHLSIGLCVRLVRRPRERTKHGTACGTVCDLTKATTNPGAVTCRHCLKRIARG